MGSGLLHATLNITKPTPDGILTLQLGLHPLASARGTPSDALWNLRKLAQEVYAMRADMSKLGLGCQMMWSSKRMSLTIHGQYPKIGGAEGSEGHR